MYVNPAFLLVDVGASMRQLPDEGTCESGYTFLVMYVMAPEKFVFLALLEGGLQMTECAYILLIGSTLLDVCGIVALGAGIGVEDLPPPLAVGYSITTLATLVVLALLSVETYGDWRVALGWVVGISICFMVPFALASPDDLNGSEAGETSKTVHVIAYVGAAMVATFTCLGCLSLRKPPGLESLGFAPNTPLQFAWYSPSTYCGSGWENTKESCACFVFGGGIVWLILDTFA
jgi:hypothetical protein